MFSRAVLRLRKVGPYYPSYRLMLSEQDHGLQTRTALLCPTLLAELEAKSKHVITTLLKANFKANLISGPQGNLKEITSNYPSDILEPYRAAVYTVPGS